MAKKLGYKSPASYMYIEKGVYEPNIKIMNELAKILGEPVQYFFELNV